MNHRHYAGLLLSLALALGATAHASSVSLCPSGVSLCPSPVAVGQGAAFTVDLVLDARDVDGIHPNLYGGKVVVDFDPLLITGGTFVLNSGLAYYSSPVTATAGGKTTVTFGFDNAPDLGVVGTFTFTAAGAAGSVAHIGIVDYNNSAGSFGSYDPGYTRIYPSFVGTDISIVPLPGGVWLLATGVGVLGSRRRWAARAPNRINAGSPG